MKISSDRCACCYQWPQRPGAIGVFTPNGGGVLFYTLCPSCAQRLKRNPGDKQALARIESYITERQPVRST